MCGKLEQANSKASPSDANSLNEQYNCQINLKIMSLHAVGTNYEKLKDYQRAINEYKKGKLLVE